MDLRRATREVVMVLDDARQSFTSDSFDTGPFAQALEAAMKETRSAADGCAIYGLHFPLTTGTPERRGSRPSGPETRALRELIDYAYNASTRMKLAVLEKPPNGERRRAARESLV
jgi:hypothetical protein